MNKVAETIRGMFGKFWAAVVAFANERLGIRTWEDLRLQIHVLSPFAVTGMVTWGIADKAHAQMIVGLVLAVASPALAAWHTRDGFRRWVYGILPPLQALIVGYGWATDSALTPIMAAVVALLGGALAAVNTRTSTSPAGTDTRQAAAA
ncbi:holin [Mycobacterium phage Hurricane]|uniref:Holin n=2 Tax=Keshuvirus TaxID=2948781 RepID=A0A222ZJ54_9CAUD|nr:holin [Mycobacterium phage ShedlockHolmes]YP_009951703.1 holin [Mycobacterium phage Hurricane]AKF15210.1 holin [Mycobacterium phage ShedlockHolmes]ASR84784.1 holin [Mycobacterium phage Hurricane]